MTLHIAFAPFWCLQAKATQELQLSQFMTKTAALCFNANKSTNLVLNAPSLNMQKMNKSKVAALKASAAYSPLSKLHLLLKTLEWILLLAVSVSHNDPWLFSSVECKFPFSLYHLTTLQGVLHVLFHPERLRRSADKARSVEQRAVLENTHAASEY